MVSGAGIQAVQALFLLLLVFVAMFAGLARRLKVPYPILLVIAGLLLSFSRGSHGFGSTLIWSFLCSCLRSCIRRPGRYRGGSSSVIS
jgi:hypothetical protein